MTTSHKIEKKVVSKGITPTPTIMEKFAAKHTHTVVMSSDKSNEDSLALPTVTPTASPRSTPTNTPSIVSTNETITAKATVIASGKTIHLSMQYAKSGGPITGSMTGDCTGTIAGTFSSSGNLSGSAKANCNAGFFQIPVTMIYTGSLQDARHAKINYTISAAGQKESGNTLLTLSQ